jgi:hypothetical protein
MLDLKITNCTATLIIINELSADYLEINSFDFSIQDKNEQFS